MLALWEKYLFKFGRFTIAMLLKAKKQSLIILWIWWPEVKPPDRVYLWHLKELNHTFLFGSFLCWLRTDIPCILDSNSWGFFYEMVHVFDLKESRVITLLFCKTILILKMTFTFIHISLRISVPMCFCKPCDYFIV